MNDKEITVNVIIPKSAGSSLTLLLQSGATILEALHSLNQRELVNKVIKNETEFSQFVLVYVNKPKMVSAGELGTGKGIYNLQAMENVKSMVSIPCVGETGILNVTEVTQLFAIGMDAVLVNSAIAQANDPLAMATAMRLAVDSALYYRAAVC